MEKKRYTHSLETRRKISKALKGKLKGRKRNPESVARGAESRKTGKYFNCIFCEVKFWRAPSAIIKGQNKFCSRKCYQIWQKGKTKLSGFKLNALRGKNHPNWKGGLTKKSIIIRNSPKMKEWRNSVFKRDDYTCQKCRLRGVFLEAHHIKPFALFENLRFDISNGVTLCKPCHLKEPKGREIYDTKHNFT